MQIHVSNIVDGQANGVFARIKHTVLACAVILEFQQVAAVIKHVDILGLAGIDEVQIIRDPIAFCLSVDSIIRFCFSVLSTLSEAVKPKNVFILAHCFA